MHRRSLLSGAAASAALAAALPRAAAAETGPRAAAAGLPLSAPIHVGAVGLRAQDAEALAAWYRMAVGLTETAREGATIWMGAGGSRLLSITEVEGLAPAWPDQAGLFHTAFLLPSRRDLARWIAMASETRLPVSGAADHRVSEAVYLTDPEGNGVEIYADAPPETWVWQDGEVQMGTYRLDVPDIMRGLGDAPAWESAPDATCVGHVHLKVGDATRAGRWWREELGFEAVSARETAEFLSTGGYHHHVAVNEWQSAGAGKRGARDAGLDFVELRRNRPGLAAQVLEDAWGAQIRLI